VTWFFLALGALLVASIALIAVGSAVSRLRGTLRPAVLEVDDAADWIAERLPVEAAGQLTLDDVVSVVGWYLEVFDEVGLATEHGQELGDAATGDGERTAPLDGILEHVVARALDRREPLDAVAVAMVAELLGTYLREVGAFGDQAGPPTETAPGTSVGP
jgi:hypothetical protein